MSGPIDPPLEPWQVLESKYSFRDRWLAVKSDTVRVPNGTVLSPYHTLEFPDWICALVLTPAREVVLIEEYRHGVRRNSVELPCGAPEPGEDVLAAMKRELLEETGYAADEWLKLGCTTANTGRQNNSVHSFVALDARRVAAPTPEPAEIIRTHVLPWQTFLDGLAEGAIDIPGLHVTALWQLRTLARRTRDPRLLALGL